MALGNLDNSFWTQQFPKWAGAAAMLGGALCVLASFLHGLQPVGCIGAECDVRPMRTGTEIVGAAGTVATLLILVGIAGLAMLARRSGGSTRLANAGLICASAGFIWLFAGILIQALSSDGNFSGMPYFVIPGLLAVMVGFLLIGIFILRSGILPRWVGMFLIVATVALVAANEQTAAVLLAIPFGLAMVAAGYFMWTSGTRYAPAPARGPDGVGGLA